MTTLRNSLVSKLEKISGLENRPSPVIGGSALHYNGKEFAHFHNDNELDLRLTKSVIKNERLSHPSGSEHHPKRASGSAWIEVRFKNPKDVNEVARLVKLAIAQL
ncbi:MAG: luciferase family protein [Arenicellales bacterium WSBS_2016_MAG_OTU3]